MWRRRTTLRAVDTAPVERQNQATRQNSARERNWAAKRNWATQRN